MSIASWEHVKRCDPRARALADRHYSRQTVGAQEFMPPGRTFVLLRAAAVWGVVENDDPAGNRRWRCSIFRNEGGGLSSDLIREATMLTGEYWLGRHGLPSVPLQTEVDPRKTRAKQDPGYCFLKAGWSIVGERRGLVILEAPRFFSSDGGATLRDATLWKAEFSARAQMVPR